MTTHPIIAVFAGGTSSEREVSLGSGAACAEALAKNFAVEFFQIDSDALPAAGPDPARHVVFSTLHGTFGEDGGMQRLLDDAGVFYAGCDAAASALTMDKSGTKRAAAAAGVRSPDGFLFRAARPPAPAEIIAALGDELVLKPNNEGSSVGLQLIAGPGELAAALAGAGGGGAGGGGAGGESEWLLERRVRGRELSVGVLAGRALGVVEIRPRSGVYDYASKYTRGATEYLAPAPLAAAAARAAQAAAETAFAACGCRDYARVDFILSGENELFLLEINTLPGMKETSLLPMSARCAGLDFTALVRELVSPAARRFLAARAQQKST